MDIGGIISGLFQGASSLWNSYNAKKSNAAALDWSKKNFILQYLQNQQNQQKQEDMQREQWSRDDNSYQRTVSDMRAAGLNPLSLQGTTSSSFSGLSSSTATLEQPNQRDESVDFGFIPQYLSLGLQGKDQAHRHKIEDTSSRDAHNLALQQQQLLEAQEREAQARAADQEYETKWKSDRGISASSNQYVSLAKEIMQEVKSIGEKFSSSLPSFSSITDSTAAKVLKETADKVSTYSAEKKTAFNNSVNKIAQEIYGKSYESLSKKEKAWILFNYSFNGKYVEY